METPIENHSLILDMLEWLGTTSRPYHDVIDAWGTSCPRFTIWEDSLDAGFIAMRNDKVYVTAEGFAFLRKAAR